MTDNNNNKEVLRESEDYKLVVGIASDKNLGQCYHVINKKTEVVEVETRLLPQAITFVDQLQENLDLYKKKSTVVETGSLEDIKQTITKLSKIH